MALEKNQKEEQKNQGKTQIGAFAHFIIILIIALVTVTIMLALYRPDILEGIWLWIIGLIGPIIAIIRRTIGSVFSYVKKLGDNKE